MKNILLSLIALILFSGCETGKKLYPPTKPIIDQNLPILDVQTLKVMPSITTAKLDWIGTDSQSAKGYYIYRKDLDDPSSIFTRIGAVNDKYVTNFIDTNLLQDRKYAWCLSVIGTNGSESMPSDARVSKTYHNDKDDIVSSNKSSPNLLHAETISPIISIDTGGHKATIKDVVVTKGGDIISASDDKTIRVWDSKTGKEKRKILGQIGTGIEGMIFTIALSSDERFLAVGGYMTNNEIRLYDYRSGELLSLLKSHENVVLDLAFDTNNNLYSGGVDKTVKVWDLSKTLNPTPKTFSEHSNVVYGVTPLVYGEFISVGYDNQIVLYDGKKAIKNYTHKEKLHFVATNGKFIATCGYGNEILIFDMKLKLLQTIISSTVPAGLAFSPDGTKLVAGTGAYPLKAIVYDVKNNFKELASFDKHTNTTMAVAFLDNYTIISGGGDSQDIYIWDSITSKVKQHIVGNGKRVVQVGINGNIIGFGNTFNAVGDYHISPSSIEKAFDLKSMSLIETATLGVAKGEVKSPFSDFKVINSSGLSHSKGGDYGDGDAILNLPNGKSITRDAYTGYRHNTYGWAKELVVSGGMNGNLKAYNNDGNTVANFIGHTGEVLSIALEGDTLVSGSSDQTINIWDLSSLKKGVTNQSIYPKISLFVGTDNEWVAWTKEGFFDASPNGAKYIGYHINKGSDKEAEFVSVDKLYKSFYRPDLVQKALKGENLDSYAKDINIQEILKGGLAPVVAIKTQSGESKKRDVELELEVCQKDGGYDNLTLYLNGMAVSVLDTNRVLKVKSSNSYLDCVAFKPLISLTNGENKIGFKATNKAGTIESNLAEISLGYKSNIQTKPNLHILAIGVDKYRDGDLQLKYSVADAKELTKSLEKNGKGLFDKVYTYQLLDGEVTKEKILAKFSEVGAKTTREDVFVFYMAGHGITDAKTGAYFYLPSDFRYKNDESVRTAGVSQEDFTLALSRIQALKSITLIDTCNSGSFAEALASRGVLQKTAIDKLTRATGRATLVASSKDQVALEGYNGHGVFTYTMIEALDGKGYKNGKLTIKNLASYIEDVLPERTYQKWGYEQVPQSHITGTDFPIGVK